MSFPKCEHGSSADTPEWMKNTLWNAPFSICTCCGFRFPYIDSCCFGSNGYSKDTTWYPKNRCAACGGKYETHEYNPERDVK